MTDAWRALYGVGNSSPMSFLTSLEVLLFTSSLTLYGIQLVELLSAKYMECIMGILQSSVLVLLVTHESYLHIRLSYLSFSATDKLLLTEYLSFTPHSPTEIDSARSKTLKW